MARKLEHVKFYELELTEHVIVEDAGEMKVGSIVEIGNGPGNMFCSVDINGAVKQFYFENIWRANDE
jgi:hypothetical protein